MKCFVIMPFGDPKRDKKKFEFLTNLFTDWIKPTVEEIKYDNLNNIECYRGDDVYKPGEIISHIIESLNTSDIVIADLSDRNPNVYYELGVRHAINNNTIIISSNLDDLPFDIRSLRAISYQYKIKKMVKFKKELRKAILSIVANPNNIDNPVRRYLFNKEADRIRANNTPPGYDPVKTLLSEMNNLKSEFKNQFQEMRSIIENITDTKQVISNNNQYALSFFEGIWKNEETESTSYGRVLDGILEIPYSYGERKHINAHYYNCQFVNNTLFCRFEWFDQPISGYALFKIISEKQISGGWWYSGSVPKDVIQNITKINESIPGMYKSSWNKIAEIDSFPAHVKKYFEKSINNK
jgi:hypothetical protein